MLRAIYYQAARASFAEIADPFAAPGSRLSPRQAGILTLDQNFGTIKNWLKADAVIILLPDGDCYQAQYGGGWPWDPETYPCPSRAVAQEIILRIADKHGLKVVFVVNPSPFHVFIDDAFGSTPPHDAPGAWQFLHSLIDPLPFYGSPETTDLEIIGLENGPIRSYFADPRIAAWMMRGEWKLGNEDGDVAKKHREFLWHYWTHFSNLVHWNGSQTPTAIYTMAGPDILKEGNAIRQRIRSFKRFFSPDSGLPQPDLFGFQWYGNDGYDQSRVATDLRTMAGWMMEDEYPLDPSRILLGEGGSNQPAGKEKNWFYADAAHAARTIDGINSVGAMFVWCADSYVNTGMGTSAFDPGIEKWAVFDAEYEPIGAKQLTSASPCWHLENGPVTDPQSWREVTDCWPAGYGIVTFTGIRPHGRTLAACW